MEARRGFPVGRSGDLVPALVSTDAGSYWLFACLAVEPKFQPTVNFTSG